MGSFGFQEILIIAIVILILFGGRKIPEFMRGLGKGIKNFKEESKGDTQKNADGTTNTDSSNRV